MCVFGLNTITSERKFIYLERKIEEIEKKAVIKALDADTFKEATEVEKYLKRELRNDVKI